MIDETISNFVFNQVQKKKIKQKSNRILVRQKNWEPQKSTLCICKKFFYPLKRETRVEVN